MVHEIYPKTFCPAYADKTPVLSDYSLAYLDNYILVSYKNGQVSLPKFSDIKSFYQKDITFLFAQSYYLFAVDDLPYFLISLPEDLKSALPVRESLPQEQAAALFFFDLYKFRDLTPLSMVFSGATGSHIAHWKEVRTYCGKCGTMTIPSKKERALVCPACGQTEYPKISPAVIVAIKNGDKLLLVKNNYGPYRKLALVAGFVEVGESFEETIHREVWEEVGLKVKNINYYKSQPWAFSETEMVGFTADLQGSDRITLQKSELAEGAWYSREEIPDMSYRLSVGSEMIHMFKTGRL